MTSFFVFSFVFGDVVFVLLLAFSMGFLFGNVIVNVMAFLLWHFFALLLGHFVTLWHCVIATVLLWHFVAFGYVDVMAALMWFLGTFLFVVVTGLTFFNVSGFTLLLLFVSAFFFVGGFAMLFLFVATFFLVDGMTFVFVECFADLFFLSFAFLGVIIAAIATFEQVQEKGRSLGFSFGIAANGQAKDKEDLKIVIERADPIGPSRLSKSLDGIYKIKYKEVYLRHLHDDNG